MSRRIKSFLVTEETLLLLFHWWRYEYVALPYIEIPRDAEILKVEYSFMEGSWYVVVEHPSFDMVEPGVVIPKITTTPMVIAIDKKYLTETLKPFKRVGLLGRILRRIVKLWDDFAMGDPSTDELTRSTRKSRERGISAGVKEYHKNHREESDSDSR